MIAISTTIVCVFIVIYVFCWFVIINISTIINTIITITTTIINKTKPPLYSIDIVITNTLSTTIIKQLLLFIVTIVVITKKLPFPFIIIRVNI